MKSPVEEASVRRKAEAVDAMGMALATNSVTVNGQSVSRKGECFRKELSVNNSSGPVWTNISVSATSQASVSGNALVPKSPEVFTYDADGNLTSDSLWTNVWNAENRLVLTESAAGVATGARRREVWTYLPDGRWMERVVSTHNGSSYDPACTNRFVWDGQVLLAVLDHTNGLAMSLLRGLDLSGTMQGAGGVGGVLAVTFRSNGTHFVCYDGNGNVMALTDAATGANSAMFEYGPFGEPVRVTGPAAAAMPLRFSTMYEDDVTGDRKYLFREYRPSLGRWLSRDPKDEDGFTRALPSSEVAGTVGWSLSSIVYRSGAVEEAGDLNSYVMVFNDTLSRFDPKGLAPCTTAEKNTCLIWKCPTKYPGAVIAGEKCCAWNIHLLVCRLRPYACNCQCQCQFIARWHPYGGDPKFDKCYWECPGFGGFEGLVPVGIKCQGEGKAGGLTSTGCAALKAGK